MITVVGRAKKKKKPFPDLIKSLLHVKRQLWKRGAGAGWGNMIVVVVVVVDLERALNLGP